MSTKSQKIKNYRKTMQLRLSTGNHKRLKLYAVNQQMTMSKTIDKIVDIFFESDINFQNR